MCTGISTFCNGHYFGRSLDISVSYPFEILVAPKDYQFPFFNHQNSHLSIIGMGIKKENYPFFFDGMNECGLGMAGLNFPNHAYYFKEKDVKKVNLAPYELIQYVLSSAKTLEEGKELLKDIHLIEKDDAFEMNTSPLHWLLADGKNAVVIENTEEGLKVYENPYHVLTNNPPFPYHYYNVTNYLNITPNYPENTFATSLKLTPNSVGLGGVGLPGDNSSPSRFVRAFYHLDHLELQTKDEVNANEFLHVLDSVIQVKGAAKDASGQDEFSAYASCISQKTMTYYVKTYENSQIQGVKMSPEMQNGKEILSFPLNKEPNIDFLNKKKRS